MRRTAVAVLRAWAFLLNLAAEVLDGMLARAVAWSRAANRRAA